MNVIREIQRINERELEEGIQEEGSWHQKYRDSAYVFVGGLDYDLTEGDVITIMSQYGEVVDCNLVRDKEKGTSRGFAFIAYEDQRSTILAVDNMNGAKLFDRTLRCDHVLEYRRPKKKKKEGENLDEKDQGGDESDETYEERRKRIWDYEKYNAQAVTARPVQASKAREESQQEQNRKSKIMAILESKKRMWKARRMAQAAEEECGGGKKIWGGEDMRRQREQGRSKREEGRMDRGRGRDRNRDRDEIRGGGDRRDRSNKKHKKKKEKKDKKEKKKKKKHSRGDSRDRLESRRKRRRRSDSR